MIRHFLRNRFRRNRVERELSNEIDGVIDLLIAEKVADRASSGRGPPGWRGFDGRHVASTCLLYVRRDVRARRLSSACAGPWTRASGVRALLRRRGLMRDGVACRVERLRRLHVHPGFLVLQAIVVQKLAIQH